MTSHRHIHIVGASGSGTTTLGAALAARLGLAHLDSDDFFWLPTDPPYATPRPLGERLPMLRAAMDGAGAWVLSGSVVPWGDALIPEFELVVFLRLDPEVRLARIAARERRRYGALIEPGGAMHAHSQAFLEWAHGYDDPDFKGRSLARHRQWLARLACPVLELDSAPPLEVGVAAVMEAWLGPGPQAG